MIGMPTRTEQSRLNEIVGEVKQTLGKMNNFSILGQEDLA